MVVEQWKDTMRSVSGLILKSLSVRLGGYLFDEVRRNLSLKKPHSSGGKLKEALYKKRKPLLVTYFFTAPDGNETL